MCGNRRCRQEVEAGDRFASLATTARENYPLCRTVESVEKPDFDAGALQGSCENSGIGAAVVVRVDDLGVEGFDCIGGFFRRHRKRNHADESRVNIFQGAHFGSDFGISRDIESRAAIIEEITVAATVFAVDRVGRGATPLVVYRDGLDDLAVPLRDLAVRDGAGGGESFDDVGGRQNLSVRRADGGWHWFLLRAVSVLHAGAPAGWLGTIIDIDAERRAREALTASEARARSIANAIPQLIGITDCVQATETLGKLIK